LTEVLILFVLYKNKRIDRILRLPFPLNEAAETIAISAQSKIK